MNVMNRMLSGWGRYPTKNCQVIRPEKYRDLHHQTPPSIARGQGRSYGDASLNADHEVILTERLNRFLHFDEQQGLLTAEAGITLKEVLEVIVPRGWFLPVTPGTQYASLGGCVAADVHGKNHHRDGSFANFIISLELITADQKKYTCSPTQHAELFWATIGGMGLTGIIGEVTIQLKKINSPYLKIKQYAAEDLTQAFYFLNDARYDDHYTVAWIDCLAEGKKLGRSIVMNAHHTEAPSATTHKNKKLRISFDMPSFLLNSKTISTFNNFYYSQQAKKIAPFVQHYENYFYPLDKITDWNRLYGKKGFVQYQCALPSATAFTGIQLLLEKLSKERASSFLAVLKRFGNSSQGLLSFPMPGFTLALDIPLRNQRVFSLLNALDDIVIAHQGRVYLAKDARLSAEHFETMYPQYKEWLKIKKHFDPNNIFSSSLSRRLMHEI